MPAMPACVSIDWAGISTTYLLCRFVLGPVLCFCCRSTVLPALLTVSACRYLEVDFPVLWRRFRSTCLPAWVPDFLGLGLWVHLPLLDFLPAHLGLGGFSCPWMRVWNLPGYRYRSTVSAVGGCSCIHFWDTACLGLLGDYLLPPPLPAYYFLHHMPALHLPARCTLCSGYHWAWRSGILHWVTAPWVPATLPFCCRACRLPATGCRSGTCACSGSAFLLPAWNFSAVWSAVSVLPYYILYLPACQFSGGIPPACLPGAVLCRVPPWVVTCVLPFCRSHRYLHRHLGSAVTVPAWRHSCRFSPAACCCLPCTWVVRRFWFSPGGFG